MSHSWQKRKALPLHTDDWLMTYADLITLLLCFFAIIIITSAPKKNAESKLPPQPVVQQQSLTVPPPAPPASAPIDVFPADLPFHPITQSDAPDDLDLPVKTDAPVSMDTPAPIVASTAPQPVEQPAPVQTEKTEDVAPSAPPAPAPTLPQIAENLKGQGPANFEQKGDRITTLEINSAAFFGSGSATISEPGMAILRNVAVSLKSDAFKDYQITVEGHTDDTPIHTAQFPSNWELSTARASAVVHFFLDQNIPATKLRAAGYADTFPKVPNRDSNGKAIPVNQAENRRVIIKLEKIDKNN
jgi:chemotaxis protein MotB